jgi:hypothetical protein
MRLREWIAAFRFLHEKARRASLSAQEGNVYREAREDLAAMLLAAQRLSLGSSETARGALRVVRALPLDLRLAAGPVRAETLDISTGGFSSLIDRAPQPDEVVACSLQLSSGPLLGSARVMSILDQGGTFRVSFRLEALSPADLEKLGSEVLDAALEQLANLVEHA